ncbi:MAG: DedA family protein [Geodermatophilaceae bacterium]
MTEFLQSLGVNGGWWLYAVLGGLAFAEAAFLLGMVLPGETALLVGGFLAHEGFLDIRIMVAVAVVCAIAGDSVGYEFGRHFGPALRRSRLGRWVGERRWQAADAFLLRHGGKAVLIGRATALLRALVPSMAGMARMPYLRTFLPWNAVGGLLWGAGCVALGYAFAASLPTVEQYLRIGPLPVVLIVVVVVVVLEVRRRRRERREVVDESTSG